MMPDVARLAALTTLSCDAVLLLDSGGGIEWSSPAITVLLGYEARELEGQSGDRFVVPDERDDWRAFVGDLQARPGVSLFTRLHCVHRDGGARWMYVTGQNLLDEPAVRAMVVRLRESTARASAAEGKPLQADELKFRALVEDSLVSRSSSSRTIGWPMSTLRERRSWDMPFRSSWPWGARFRR